MPVWRRRADASHARGIGKGEARRAFFRNQAEGGLQQRLFQIAVMIAALGAALFLAPAHVKGFYMKHAPIRSPYAASSELGPRTSNRKAAPGGLPPKRGQELNRRPSRPVSEEPA
ncbi:hypothetical protein GALL_523430 [mine drainage metagenome]|uniref:Transmembrane protein n=1 Tax=mine drainage metagenome TaxID=410659 RepID=A0A1J5P4K1_9ZZZZ